MAKDFWKKSKSLQKYIGFRISSVLFFHPVHEVDRLCKGQMIQESEIFAEKVILVIIIWFQVNLAMQGARFNFTIW